MNQLLVQIRNQLPKSSWRPPKISELPSWRDAKRIGLDTETRDPDLKTLGPGVRRDGEIVGISFSIEDGPKHYLPFGHGIVEDNLDKKDVIRYIKDQVKVFKGTFVGANISYDLDYLLEEGIDFHSDIDFYDIQIAEPLIDELQDRYSLEAIAQKYLGVGKTTDLLKQAYAGYGIPKPGRDLWMLPARYVGPYAEDDADEPCRIARRQDRIIVEQDLQEVFALESKLMPVLVKMRRKGVRINTDKLRQIELWAKEEAWKAVKEIKKKTGVMIDPEDVMKPEGLVPVLEYIGVTIPLTPKTKKPSISKDLLESIDDPVAVAIRRTRKMFQLKHMFCDSIWTHLVDGRIHCTFNQLRKERNDEGSGDLRGAAYGRLSSENPNMQQQPARDPELGPLWRSIYIPEEGSQWASLDYSAQEPRMVVHFATLIKLPGAQEMADKYCNDPDMDNHQITADMMGIKRKDAKEIFLGLCYGMGGAKLCGKLGLPTAWKQFKNGETHEVAGPEGAALLSAFNLEVPFVKQLSKECQKKANQRGYIKTITGRRCRFPAIDFDKDMNAIKWDWTHKALNRLIQGSSACQTKSAMVQADAAGYELQLAVHDELDLSVENREQAEAVANIMRHCVKLLVPSKVDVEVGPSWGEVEEAA